MHAFNWREKIVQSVLFIKSLAQTAVLDSNDHWLTLDRLFLFITIPLIVLESLEPFGFWNFRYRGLKWFTSVATMPIRSTDYDRQDRLPPQVSPGSPQRSERDTKVSRATSSGELLNPGLITCNFSKQSSIKPKCVGNQQENDLLISSRNTLPSWIMRCPFLAKSRNITSRKHLPNRGMFRSYFLLHSAKNDALSIEFKAARVRQSNFRSVRILIIKSSNSWLPLAVQSDPSCQFRANLLLYCVFLDPCA